MYNLPGSFAPSSTPIPQAALFTTSRVDVDSNAELRRQYNAQVPVVFINGRKAFKDRMDEQELPRKLASRLWELRSGQ